MTEYDNTRCRVEGDEHVRRLDDGYELRHPAEGCEIADLEIDTNVSAQSIRPGNLIILDGRPVRVVDRYRQPSMRVDEDEWTVTLWHSGGGSPVRGLDGSRVRKVIETE